MRDEKRILEWLHSYKAQLEEFIYARGHGLSSRQTGLTHARKQLVIVESKIGGINNEN